MPKSKTLLVGMKKDLRDDQTVIEELAKAKESPVSYEDGEQLSRAINAECYLECSILKGKGIEEIFRRAAEISAEVFIDHDGKEKKKCCIM